MKKKLKNVNKSISMFNLCETKNNFQFSTPLHYRGIFVFSKPSKHGSLCLILMGEKSTGISSQFYLFFSKLFFMPKMKTFPGI